MGPASEPKFSQERYIYVVSDWVEGNIDNLVLLVIYVVPQERRSIVKPQRGNIHFTISPFHHSYSSPRKEKHCKIQRRKVKRNPPEESMGISNTKENLSWHQKEVIPRCQRESFAPTKFEIQILGLKFWAQGRVFQDLKKRISPLHGLLFF